MPLPQGKIEISTDYTYRSDAFTDFSPAVFDYAGIPSSVLLNASVGYVTDRWSLALFGTNLTNNHLVSIIDVNTNAHINQATCNTGAGRGPSACMRM